MNCISILLTLSLHLGMSGDFNEINPHLRCEVANSNFGMYYNSEDYPSSPEKKLDWGADRFLFFIEGS